MSAAANLEYGVREYDAQRAGMTLVSGWEVWAQVIGVTGRKFAPVLVALCPDKADAERIAAWLREETS